MEGFLISYVPYPVGDVVREVWLEPNVEAVRLALKRGGCAISVVQTDKRYIPLVNGQIPCKEGKIMSSTDISLELRQFAIWCVVGLDANYYAEWDSKRETTKVASLFIRDKAREALHLAQKFISKEINQDQLEEVYCRIKPVLKYPEHKENTRENFWQKMFVPKYSNMPRCNHAAELASLYLTDPDPAMSVYWTWQYADESILWWHFRAHEEFQKACVAEFQRMIISVLNAN